MDRGGNRRYSVVGEEERLEAFELRKVAEGDDGIVGEVYGIVLVLVGLRERVQTRSKRRTLVTPRFSMAGILYPSCENERSWSYSF